MDYVDHAKVLDFIRQSIASGNVQGTIERVVGLLAAKATILLPKGRANEGFEKKWKDLQLRY